MNPAVGRPRPRRRFGRLCMGYLVVSHAYALAAKEDALQGPIQQAWALSPLPGGKRIPRALTAGVRTATPTHQPGISIVCVSSWTSRGITSYRLPRSQVNQGPGHRGGETYASRKDIRDKSFLSQRSIALTYLSRGLIERVGKGKVISKGLSRDGNSRIV